MFAWEQVLLSMFEETLSYFGSAACTQLKGSGLGVRVAGLIRWQSEEAIIHHTHTFALLQAELHGPCKIFQAHQPSPHGPRKHLRSFHASSVSTSGLVADMHYQWSHLLSPTIDSESASRVLISAWRAHCLLQ